MQLLLKKRFIFSLSCLFLVSLNLVIACKPVAASYHHNSTEFENIPITSEQKEDSTISSLVSPYRTHIDNDLNKVLSFAPETMDKNNGNWQTTIGNLFAEATLELSNPVFEKRYGKSIDMCMLNNGGIRSIISKGPVTTRTAFEVMPFENNTTVLELKGSDIMALANYMIAERKPHPLANIQIFIDKNNKITKVMIRDKELDLNKTYFVVTNDYLAQGGDRMFFFKNPLNTYELDYKLRNILIDYFTKHPSLPIIHTQRVIPAL